MDIFIGLCFFLFALFALSFALSSLLLFLSCSKKKPLINTDRMNLPPGWKLEQNSSGKYRLITPEGRYYAMKSAFATRKDAIDNAWYWVDLRAEENDSSWKVVEGE